MTQQVGISPESKGDLLHDSSLDLANVSIASEFDYDAAKYNTNHVPNHQQLQVKGY